MSQLDGEKKNDYIKRRTLELYDLLPQNKEERKKHIEIRDEIIELNYAFFGYVATHTFINNSSITYEDKLQSALMHFCECWWWYKWQGDETHKGYRQDLSFTVFFKPRVGEMIERELNEVKYSVRRDLLMLAGKQLGKHWAKVTYDDLKDVKLDADKMASLKAIFGSMYVADLETHAMFISSKDQCTSILDEVNDNYDSIEDFLVHEMIEEERRLTDKDLQIMAETYSLDIDELHKCLPKAEKRLHQELLDKINIQDAFSESNE